MTKNNKKSRTPWIIAIILVLIFCLLVIIETLNSLPDYAREVRQKADYITISIAIEFFNSEFEEYPPSDGLDPNGIPYCGAMKLAEAMIGKDLLGCHKDSIFRSDGKDPNGNKLLYAEATFDPNSRKGPYIPLANAKAYIMEDVYEDYGNFLPKHLILTDVFHCVTHRKFGSIIGMPILYYKADTSKSSHDINNPDNPDNIYNYKDNYDLLALGVPSKPGVKHPLYEDPSLFYRMTQNTKAKTSEPHNKDSYILISAGQDGLYGTSDDITNFDFKWRSIK